MIREFSGDGNEIYGSALSPDGSLLAGGTQVGDIILWDVATGAKLRAWSGHAGLLLRLTFYHDGTRLASAGFDRVAKVWDVASGAELVTLFGNTSNVFGVSFHPDGDRLSTAGADGTLRAYTLDPETPVALAHERLTRTLTDEECRKYLHLKKCP